MRNLDQKQFCVEMANFTHMQVEPHGAYTTGAHRNRGLGRGLLGLMLHSSHHSGQSDSHMSKAMLRILLDCMVNFVRAHGSIPNIA